MYRNTHNSNIINDAVAKKRTTLLEGGHDEKTINSYVDKLKKEEKLQLTSASKYMFELKKAVNTGDSSQVEKILQLHLEADACENTFEVDSFHVSQFVKHAFYLALTRGNTDHLYVVCETKIKENETIIKKRKENTEPFQIEVDFWEKVKSICISKPEEN